MDNQEDSEKEIKYYLPSVAQQSRIISFSKTPLALFQEKQNSKEEEMFFNRMYLAVPYEKQDGLCEDGSRDFHGLVSCTNDNILAFQFNNDSNAEFFSEEDYDQTTPCGSYQNCGFLQKLDSDKKLPNDEKGFADICGLKEAKQTLRNVFISPMLFPHLFPENIQWNRVLLYGPPGTGKTILAKAIASEANCALHKISSADLLSHWQGETEKQIRNLFRQVRSNNEPAIIFFDEIDGLCRKRTSSEDDLVRRIKTELLMQFEEENPDSCNKSQTYIIGATNCPWDIDSAFLRRFHRKIYIPLPDKASRIEILKNGLSKTEISLTDQQWDEAGEKTEGYSGSDLKNIVMAACCERLHQMMRCKHWIATGNIWVPSSPNSLFSTRLNFEDIPPHQIGSRSINFNDLEAAIGSTSKTVSSEELAKFAEFANQHKA